MPWEGAASAHLKYACLACFRASAIVPCDACGRLLGRAVKGDECLLQKQIIDFRLESDQVPIALSYDHLSRKGVITCYQQHATCMYALFRLSRCASILVASISWSSAEIFLQQALRSQQTKWASSNVSPYNEITLTLKESLCPESFARLAFMFLKFSPLLSSGGRHGLAVP